MKKAKAFILSGALIVFAACLTFSLGFNNSGTSDYDGNAYAQIHTVPLYEIKNSIYALFYGDVTLTPLDGSDGNPDLCIPALCKNDGFVPQGLAYYEEKDWFLVSAYSSEKEKVPSVIFAIDGKTGENAATYALYNVDKTAFCGHIGGIGVSNNNLYVTTDGAEISYIPLEKLTQQNELKELEFEGTADLSEFLGEAGTSYLSVTENKLCTGNFYHTKDGYDKKASVKANSVVLSFELKGNDSITEWECLVNSAPKTYYLPDTVTKIQSAVILGDKMHLSSSYGRRNDSAYYVIDLAAGNEIKEENISKYKCLPMMEGIAVKNNELYFITESAAYKYYGKEFFSRAKNPTDVIWKIGN